MNSDKSTKRATDSKALEQPKLDLRREEDFTLKYSNHIALEQSGYDLKVTFGRMDLSAGPGVVFQSTAVVMPWPAVKTLIYLLQVQLATYEGANGHVPYPQGGITELPQSVPAQFSNVRNIKATYERLRKMYDEFIAANPEAAPDK